MKLLKLSVIQFETYYTVHTMLERVSQLEMCKSWRSRWATSRLVCSPLIDIFAVWWRLVSVLTHYQIILTCPSIWSLPGPGHQRTSLGIIFKMSQFVLVIPGPLTALSEKMENVDTDLVREEQRRSKRSLQDLQSLRTGLVNSTNKMKNCLKTLATLYPSSLV